MFKWMNAHAVGLLLVYCFGIAACLVATWAADDDH